MNIAVIGWGSLIWCPGNLRIKTRWRVDGPRLPIEFARISEDGRLTLVILPGSKEQGTYWAVSECESLDKARRNLRKREGANASDIHYTVRGDPQARDANCVISEQISEWLAPRDDLGAAIWTGLSSNWNKKRGRDFTSEDAVRYLECLEALGSPTHTEYRRAREYITNAPPLIGTEVRQMLRARGWDDAELPGILFD